MPDWFYIILGPCIAIVSLGVYSACMGYSHQHTAAGDHLLYIIQRASEDTLGEDDDA